MEIIKTDIECEDLSDTGEFGNEDVEEEEEDEVVKKEENYDRDDSKANFRLKYIVGYTTVTDNIEASDAQEEESDKNNELIDEEEEFLEN